MAQAVGPSIETAGPSLPPPKTALTPPTSEEWNQKVDNDSSSELSDVEEDDDIGEIEPDHYYDGGKIPVFKPTMDQFRSFKKFVDKIDKYGMKSGIVKVIPPKEWRDSLQALDEAVKTIKVKNPITQEFSGTHGTYTQANIEKQRSYNLPQWKALTEESQHQPPAKRGERRRNIEKPAVSKPKPAPRVVDPNSTQEKRRPGRPRKNPIKPNKVEEVKEEDAEQREESTEQEEGELQVPPTPTSPENQAQELVTPVKPEATTKRPKSSTPRTKGSQAKSISERRKYNQRETADQVDEAAFEDFDYRFHGNDEFTQERCAELENLYWKGLTFAPPMYGADMPGSLFDEATSSWNVAKLENLLDILGQKVPGVNTAYLYLGMWKATFAWHLEDVDLYSINYIHFGAPKQWYSISQEDARRFENAMRNVWPNDYKNCSQFLRHKTYLISPALLQSQYGIKVNKLVHNEGEFVITFPYGYHSGYNLGYNCAESVNFATEAWLDYGRIAKKCECEADSVWIDVEDIERKLRGDPTPEYYEVTDDEDDFDEEDSQLPSPPASVAGRNKAGRKRKLRAAGGGAGQPKVKRIKIRLRTNRVEPCVLCPNDIPGEPLLSTDNGRRAHQVCALYTPETFLEQEESGEDTVRNIANIDKARLELKCFYCRSRKGACFQCSAKKCARSFHATCAMAAGVQVDFGPTPEYDEDGTEYYRDVFDFRCRFHRVKRPKSVTVDSLENNSLLREYGKSLQQGEVLQAQFLQGDVFAGIVVENRPSERTVVIQVLPEGDQVEIEWKWLLKLAPSESLIVKPSPNAKPLPEHLLRQAIPERNPEFGPPKADDAFCDPMAVHKWAEFNTLSEPLLHVPKIDLFKPNQVWHYLPRISTEAKPKYTEDPAKPRDNPASRPVEVTVKPTLPKPIHIPKAPLPLPLANAPNARQPWKVNPADHTKQGNIRSERPYNYKPKPDSFSFKYGSSPYSQATNAPPPSTYSGYNFVRPSPSHAGQSFAYAGHLPVRLSYDYIPGRGLSNETNLEASPPQSRPPQPGVAPMATMSGSRPTSSQQNSVSSEYLNFVSKYPYLKNAVLRRQAYYKSPYPISGGYADVYLPRSMVQQMAPDPGYRPQQAPPPPSDDYGGGSYVQGYSSEIRNRHQPPMQSYRPEMRQSYTHQPMATGYAQFAAEISSYAAHSPTSAEPPRNDFSYQSYTPVQP